MQKKNKWVLYGATGALGLGVMAGGAAVAANAMDLRTTQSTSLPGGALTGSEAMDRTHLREQPALDPRITVVSVPSADSVGSTPTAATPASVDSAPSAVSVPSPDSAASAPSAASVASADSP